MPDVVGKRGKIIKNWKDPRKNSKSPGFSSSEFVQYELNKEQALTCKEWRVEPVDLFLALIKLTEAGYKVTFRYDERNKCEACWIIGPSSEGGQNANMILPGRGSTPEKAFKQCLFKHYKLFEERWPKSPDREQGELIDD